eukprot:jgi/Botrbrau1/12774/Bobra.0238s0012.1
MSMRNALCPMTTQSADGSALRVGGVPTVGPLTSNCLAGEAQVGICNLQHVGSASLFMGSRHSSSAFLKQHVVNNSKWKKPRKCGRCTKELGRIVLLSESTCKCMSKAVSKGKAEAKNKRKLDVMILEEA